MANTYAEIISRVYHHLAVDNDSTTYDLATVVKPKINSVIKNVSKWRYKNIIDKRIIKAGDLKFVKWKAFYDFVTPRPLGAPLSVIDWNMTLKSSEYLPAWYVYIVWDVIQYTGNTWTTLTGLTGTLTSHKLWDVVEQIYPVPADADRSFTMYEIDRYWVEQPIDYVNSIHGLWSTPSYSYWIGESIWTIVNDNSWNNYILIRSPHGQNQKYKLWYYRKATTLLNDSDLCILPDDIWIEIIAPIVAWELLYTTEEDEQWMKLLNISYDMLEMFFADQVDFNKEYRKKVAVWNKASYFYPDIPT